MISWISFSRSGPPLSFLKTPRGTLMEFFLIYIGGCLLGLISRTKFFLFQGIFPVEVFVPQTILWHKNFRHPFVRRGQNGGKNRGKDCVKLPDRDTGKQAKTTTLCVCHAAKGKTPENLWHRINSN